MLDLSSPQAKIGFGATALLIGFFIFFPVYWLVISAFKTNEELYRIVPSMWPQTWSLEHFRYALTEGGLLLQLGNTLFVSLGSALINCTMAVYAGYSFAKYRYFGRRPVMLFMLSAQMFPFGLLLITIYPMFTTWGLLDTRLGLMISYIVFALPVATYMLYSYFSQVPNELIEAARARGKPAAARMGRPASPRTDRTEVRAAAPGPPAAAGVRPEPADGVLDREDHRLRYRGLCGRLTLPIGAGSPQAPLSRRFFGIAISNRSRPSALSPNGIVASIIHLVPTRCRTLPDSATSEALSRAKVRMLGIITTSRSACTRVVSDHITWRRSSASISSSTAIASFGCR